MYSKEENIVIGMVNLFPLVTLLLSVLNSSICSQWSRRSTLITSSVLLLDASTSMELH
jgi:hypothetical protein